MELIGLASLAMLVFGVFLTFLLLIGKKAGRLKLIMDFIARGLRILYPQDRDSKSRTVTPYDGLTDGEVNRIIANAISVLTVVGATYGVLFALVTSEKSSLAFSSWAFVIWCGWVLAILMRICGCGALFLSDYHEWDRKRKIKTLYGISKFAKHASYLLIPTASFVPLFSVAKTISIDEIVLNYPWGRDVSMFLGVFSIASIAVFFYAFVLASEHIMRRQYVGDIYMYVIPMLWGIGLFSISFSPLAPVASKPAGVYLFEPVVPSIINVVATALASSAVTFGGFGIIGLFLGMILRALGRY